MQNIQAEIDQYLKERGWDNLRPGDLAKSISIEAAELLELFQWSNPTLEEIKKDGEKMGDIKRELADVFIYALDMAVVLGVDAEQIIKEKLEYVKNKYPAELMRKSARKAPGSEKESTYLKIKEKHRRGRSK